MRNSSAAVDLLTCFATSNQQDEIQVEALCAADEQLSAPSSISDSIDPSLTMEYLGSAMDETSTSLLTFEHERQSNTGLSNQTFPPLASHGTTLPTVRSKSAEVVHPPMERFQAYVEDNLGSFAPSFRGPQDDTGPLHTNASESHNGMSASRRRWDVDMSSRSTLDLELQIANVDSSDMEYLRAKGAFDLPPRKIQEDLVEAYFAEVHPTAPVINKTDFLAKFYSHQVPNRLLLFAIFTSGSRASRNPALLDHRGTNHTMAQRFYKATKVGE